LRDIITKVSLIEDINSLICSCNEINIINISHRNWHLAEKNHFWAGSTCSMRNPNSVYPTGVIAISDILTINSDLGNKTPDRSWMIYMLELFIDKGHNPYPVPLELDLFCQFDNNNEFKAVFNGNNQYRFPNILPDISNSYLREIILNTLNTDDGLIF
jgi:hypothetical protein